jgi:hypothetical protein
MKKLPIGIQTFERLRQENYVYVDKTEQIHRLLTSASYYFLSRPRRFGKSLTLSTIRAIYEGKEELFEGLWIKDKWDWTQTRPVVHIQFNEVGYLVAGLETALYHMLQEQAKRFGIQFESTFYDQQFKELLQKIVQVTGQKVILLIDEYDKPLIDYLEKEKLPTAFENQSILKSFYSIIKSADPYIEFMLITGVSKFSKVSIFSDLNHLDDITFDKRFGDIVGYSQSDVETFFEEWIALALEEKVEPTRAALLAEIKTWYNGYWWGGQYAMYNPFSILSFFAKRHFDDYWFKTGTPSFLIKKMEETLFFNPNDLMVNTSFMESYTLDNLELRSLLFQTGYLTIRHMDRETGIYTLDYPNREVEQALTRHLMGALLHKQASDTSVPVILLRNAFREQDTACAIEIINAMLKDVPAELFQKSGERFYHALVHLHFRYLGLLIQSEVWSFDGRLDSVVQTDSHVFILEFKIDQNAQTALQQIEDKHYADRYRAEGKAIVGVGINFSTEKRAIDDWRQKTF